MQPSYEISVGRRVVCLPLTKEREKERERFFFFFYWEWLNFTGRGDGERWFRFIVMGNENRARRENRGYHGRRGTNDTITIIILFIIPERERERLRYSFHLPRRSPSTFRMLMKRRQGRRMGWQSFGSRFSWFLFKHRKMDGFLRR